MASDYKKRCVRTVSHKKQSPADGGTNPTPKLLNQVLTRNASMQSIRTERLLLRDLKEDDWQAVHDYASDPEVVRYMGWGPNSKRETKSFVDRALAALRDCPRRDYTLGIVVVASNRLIGGCGIHVSSPENREGWLGYCLNRHFWRRGYATETARGLTEFGFKDLGLHRIFATCDPANAESAHVLEKVGMKCEGHIREHRWAKGSWRDSLLYSILEQEWKLARSSHLLSTRLSRRKKAN